MKILTINTWNTQGPWQQRQLLLTQEIASLSPDVLALQEAVDGNWVESVGQKTGLSHVYFPENQSGLAILSKYPFAKTEEIMLKAQAKTEEFSRSICYARNKIKGQEVHIFNVHLSWRPHDHEVRRKQIQELLEYAEGRIKPGQMGVFLGDFNGHEDEEGINLISQTPGIVDLYRFRHAKEPGYTWSDQNPYTHKVKLPNRRLDYIFALALEKKLSVKESKIVLTQGDAEGVFPTDHFALWGECEVEDG